MKKMLKRAVVLLLVLAVVSVPLMAAASPPVAVPPPPQPPSPREDRSIASGESMERALVAIRSLVNIDDDLFTDFNYSSTYSNWETREGLVWSFNWSAENAFAFATVMDDGTLLNFNMSQFGVGSFGFAEFSREEAIEKASAFIRAANPRIHQFFGEPEFVRANLHSDEISMTFHAQISGYAFPTATIWVGVNKFTGEIASYSTNNINPSRFNFESATNLIGERAAVAVHAREIGLTLEYRSNFDFENDRIRVFPIYVPNSQGVRFISATTGEVVEHVFDTGRDGITDASFASGGGASWMMPPRPSMADGGFAMISPAERTAIEQVAGFLTSDQALARFLEAAELSDLDLSLFEHQSISLNRDWIDRDRFIYSINLFRNTSWDEEMSDEFTSISGSVDAATGRVRSFDLFSHGNNFELADEEMAADEIEAAVEAFLRRLAPEELARTRLEERDPAWATRFGFGGVNHFVFGRYENNIPFRNNQISAIFNPTLGRVTNFALNWFDNVTFPSIDNVLTPQDALAAFVEQKGMNVIYTTTGGGTARLVYDLFSNALIDPFDGSALDFFGQPWEETMETPSYSDVSGHWSERFVMRLLENGVYKWTDPFEPDRVVTELEFLQYIMLVEQPWVVAQFTPEAFFAQRGIEIEASSTRPLTRQLATKIIVEYLGFGRLAQQSQWFVFPFSDNVAEQYRGFITIAHMLGIVSGDAEGRFNATSNVTRAQASAMLHNLIIFRSE